MHTVTLRQKGFTLMEIVVVVAISTLLLGISLSAFTGVVNRQTIEKDTENVYAMLQKARNLAIDGVDGSQYGVRFASTTITLFKGTGYSATNPTNQVTSLGAKTEVSWINLTSGTSTIYFSKINGKPSATGTIEIILKSNSTIKEVITIHGSGLSEVQ